MPYKQMFVHFSLNDLHTLYSVHVCSSSVVRMSVTSRSLVLFNDVPFLCLLSIHLHPST